MRAEEALARLAELRGQAKQLEGDVLQFAQTIAAGAKGEIAMTADDSDALFAAKGAAVRIAAYLSQVERSIRNAASDPEARG